MTCSYRHFLSKSDDLHVSRTLARAIGLNSSIFVRRLQSWLEYNEEHRAKQEETHFRDDRWWSYNTYQEWADDIDVMSVSTIRRAIQHAENLGIVISTDAYNQHANDSTKWYSIDYETYEEFMTFWHENGAPNGNQQSKAYKQFVAKWREYRSARALFGLLMLGNRAAQVGQPKPGSAAQVGQPKPSSAAQVEQSVTSRVNTAKSSITKKETEAAADDPEDANAWMREIPGIHTVSLKKSQANIQGSKRAVATTVQKFGSELVLKAIEIADMKDKREWAYVVGVLQNFEKERLTSGTPPKVPPKGSPEPRKPSPEAEARLREMQRQLQAGTLGKVERVAPHAVTT